ncbi:P-loop containing nucleoside triphosphate hydrolase protein, partial [Cadophora sp. DSE1049]
YVLVLRRKFNIMGERTTTNLEIRSPHIQKAFRAVLGDYPSISFDSTLVEIPKPYAPLFHYRRELREYASDGSRSMQENEHLDVLMKFMEKNLSQTEREFGYSEPYQMVSYPLLWTLFRPEEVIIAQGDHFDECYIVDSVEYIDKVHPGTDVDMTPYLKIHARRWEYNGTRFGMSDEKLKIREFPTAVKIDTLKVYPIRFHKKESTVILQRRLIERGRKWRTILDKSHRYYDGTVGMFQVSGRIMLDYGTHKQAAPQLATNLSTSGAATEKDYKFQSIVKSDSADDTSMARKASDKEDRFMSHLNTPSYEISDEQALLCPARVRGYSFLEKIWAFFLVDDVQEIDWHTNAFESLELDPRMKSAILAMVSTHRHNDNFDDIIPGKGKGLVFLLYGRPGLGKTLTAGIDCCRVYKDPLYSITSGELGTEVAQTDFQLRTIFARAKVWDAIVLLDEADVFLAQRSATDLKRNAYVSVFLRLIEYHKGIMFLTTNRLQDFDDAFQSRIHLTIRYEALDSIRRASIWGNFLKKVKS